MTLKLYQVTCRGMVYTSPTRLSEGEAYVVAESSDAAYQALKDELLVRNLGTPAQRELHMITLVAEDTLLPDCQMRLLFAREMPRCTPNP